MKRTTRGYKLATALIAFAGSLYGGVDLIVDSINLSTDPVAPGDVVPITVTISNVGDTDVAGGTEIAVKLTSTLTNAGSLSMSSYNELAAGATTTVDFSFMIDEADLNGSYPISIEVDPDNTIAEDSDGNNGPAAMGAVIVEAFPNLAPEAIDLGTGPFYPGDTIGVEVEYSNAGNRATLGGFDITATLVAPATGTSSTVSTSVGALGAGGSGIVTLSLPIDLDNPNGSYEVDVSIDSGSAVDEGEEEGDNMDTATFEIDTKPDLEITDFNYETGTWEAGDIVDFSLSYHNAPSAGSAGTVRVNADTSGLYQIEVVLSTDDVFGNEDDFLLYMRRFAGNPVTGGNLLPNDPGDPGFVAPQEITLSWAQALPANFFGDYFVLAKIDTLEEQDEYVEADHWDNGNNIWYPAETAKIALVPSENAQAVTYRGSVASDGTEGESMSEKPALSADGRYLVFSSLSPLVEEDTDSYFDIYRRDNHSGEVMLVSRPLEIATLSDGDSQYPSISANGRFVVYQSTAANLVVGDNNGHIDIFVTDTTTGITTLASRDSSGGWADGSSALPSISADGDVVVYQSMATDLIAGGTTAGTLRVFAYDVSTETTTLLSGATANGDSFEPKVSGDGAFSVFTSEATNLVGGVTLQQVYRVDIGSGALLLVSTTGAAEGNDESFNPSINEDGSVVAYATHATNIDVPGGWVDQDLAEIIVADIAGSTVTPERLLTAAGAQFNDASTESPVTVGSLDPVLSADGSRVLFRTQSTNILPTTKSRSDGDLYDEGVDGVAVGYTDLNTYNTRRVAVSDLYLFDRDSGEYQIASLNTFGFPGAYLYFNIDAEGEDLPSLPSSRDGVISADGRYVAFSSDGRGYTGFAHGRTNRLSPDVNEVRDVFVRDLRTGAEVVVTDPPTVSLTAPLDGASVTEGELVPLVVESTDVAPGYIETVYVTVNGTVVATLTEADYQFGWVPELPGTFEVGAMAVDSDGLTAVATSLTVTVNPAGAPSAAISFPADGQQAWSGQALTISAQANDADGRVVQVEFYANGESVGVDATAPYALSWTPDGVGIYDLVVVATDNTGKLGYSSANRLTVVDATAPLVNIASPASGSNVVTGETITLSTEVTGSSSSITQVEYFVNGSSIGTATSSSGVWEIEYTPIGMGTLNVQAVATDSSSNLYGSSIATYTLVAGSAPTVSLVAPDPTDGDADDLADNDLAVDVPLTLSAMAADSDGSVASVEFYVNGVSVGFGAELSTLGLYELSYTPALIGVITVEVIATDDDGGATVSSLDYNVVSGTAPAVTIVSPDPTDGDVDLEADAALTLSEEVVFSANANDADGSVASVEFFIDGVSQGLATERSSIGVYELDITPSLKGTFTFAAIATDNLGNESTISLDYVVSEGAAPTATITAPLTGSSLPVDELVTFAVDAADADGSVASVELFVNGTSIGAGIERTTLGTYEVDYTPGALGTITVVAEVTDDVGNVTTTSESYTVVAGAAPAVALVAPDPTDGDADDLADNTLTLNVPITLAASASDTDGTVSSVQFFVNGISVGFGTQLTTLGLYELSYTPGLAGVNTISVMVTDDDDNSSSVSLDYNVIDGAAPVVSIETPNPTDADANLIADNALTLNEAALLSVEASDADGAIASVQFFIDGASIGFAAERTRFGTWEMDYSPSLLGMFNFSAVVTDNIGNQTIVSLAYVVTEGAVPTVTLLSPDPADAEPDGVADTALVLNNAQVIAASAADSDGTVSRVEFFVNGVSLGIGAERTTLGTYEIDYTPSVLGTLAIEVQVTDNVGNIVSDTLDYSVVSGSVPVLSINTPDPTDADSDGIADDILIVRRPFVFSVDATDADGSVSEVRIYENGTLRGFGVQRTSVSTWEFEFQPMTPGVRILRAEARDNLGNVSEIEQAYFVSSGISPVINVVVPDPTDADGNGLADATLVAGEAVSIQFSASDPDGELDTLQLRANGLLMPDLTEVSTGVFAAEYTPSTPGILEVSIIATDDAGNETIVDQAYSVSAGVPPTFSFVFPDPADADSDGSADEAIPYNQTVAFGVEVSDADGAIKEVRFYRNGFLYTTGVKVDSSGTYEGVIVTNLLGNFRVDVEVEDAAGNIAVGGLTYEVVDGVGAPSIALLTPTVTDLTLGNSYEFLVEVTDEDSILTTNIFVNHSTGDEGFAVGANRWSVILDPVRVGPLLVEVEAFDSLGNRTQEFFRFDVSSGVLPTVEIVTPSSGMTYLPGTSLPVQANAYDADGLVSVVQYYLNSVLVASASAPFRSFIPLPTEGTYTLEAIATDNALNRVLSAPVTINVGPFDNERPRVIMSHPIPLGGGDSVNDISIASETWINAEVTDPDGDTIEKVRFYVNGQLIEEVTEGMGDRYSTFFNTNTYGSFFFFAEAEDSEGNVGQGIPIFLDVGTLDAQLPSVRVRPILERSPVREPVQLIAEATGGLIDLARVDFFANGILVGSVVDPAAEGATGDLYSLTWLPEYPADYEITAQAVEIDPAGDGSYDNWRISSDPALITITPEPTSAQPSVTLVYPEEGQAFAVDSRVLFQAGATDTDGTVAQVEFYIEDNYLDTAVIRHVDTSAPYTFEWVPTVQGEFRVNAIAVDNDGDYNRSATTTVFVIPASGGSPTVTIVNPDPTDLDGDGVADSEIRVNTPTTLGVDVSDAEHAIDSVTFFSNGDKIGDASKATPPGLYEMAWTPTLVGIQNIVAAVRDIRGNETYSMLRYSVVTVAPPTVSLLSPSDGATVRVGNSIVMQASAADSTGSISQVDFYANNVLLGSDTTYPYSLAFSPESLGFIEIVARATNSAGVTALSGTNRVEIIENSLTSISILNPGEGSIYNVGDVIPLIAEVTTTGAGADLLVEFEVNGELVGSSTAAPYRIYWTPISQGNFAISAKVTEINSGAQSSAEDVNIVVNASTKPVFTSLAPTVSSPTAGSDVQIVADVTDADGFVSSVRFSVNGQDLGTDLSSPFSAFWAPESAGTYYILAEAVDNAGNITLFSNSITVQEPIGQVPSVSLSVTANGNVSPGSRIMVSANIFDDDPEGVEVTFFLNGTQLGETIKEPPHFTIVEPVVGQPPFTYTLTALATDADGNSRAKTLEPLYVSDLTIDQPTVNIITPVPYSVDDDNALTQGSRTTILAEVGGAALPNVLEVIFYANGVLIDRDATAPYSIDWIPPATDNAEDTYEITCAVVQNPNFLYIHSGLVTTPITPVTVANTVEVVVREPAGDLPSISFQVLPEVENLAQGSQVILYADAQDYGGGWVRKVEFRRDGEAFHTINRADADDTVPFYTLWTPQQAGESLLSAVATDDEGNVVESNFVGVQVSPTVVTKTPEIDLVSDDSSGQAGDFITLRSSVRNFVNGPDGVVFHIDGQPVGTAATKPYNFVWEANLEGTVSLFATARHTLFDGTIVTTASIASRLFLEEDENPVITAFDITWPGKSDTSKPNPLVNESLTITVGTADNGRVERIELVRNGETVTVLDDVSATTIIDELPPALGEYEYKVFVTDNAGRQTESDSITVTVALGDVPTAMIISPLGDDLSYLPGESITVRASAGDTDGTVVGVEFFVDGVSTGDVDMTPPYEMTFTPSISKSYVLTVRSEDNSGNLSAESVEVTVEVLPDVLPWFEDFSVNLETGSGSFDDPFIARIGQTFTINTVADDDHGVLSVTLERNGESVAAPGANKIPSQFSDTLEFPAKYGYLATVADTGNNAFSAERIYVEAITGSRPVVTFESPSDDSDVEAGTSVPIRVKAEPGAEPVGPEGTVVQVEFRANGTTFATLSSPPYTAGFTPASAGIWEISVVATSDTGVNSAEAIISLVAVDENLPEIVSFTNDSVGNQSLFEIPITFDVVAIDETGIRKVEIYRVAEPDVKVGEVLSEPFSSVYTPYPLDGGTLEDDRIAAGTHGFFARVFNSAGLSIDSDPIEINIRYPRPLENIEDYVFQTYLDLLLRIPVAAERNAAVSTFDPNRLPLEQDASIALVLNILENDEYIAVRSAMLGNFLLTGEWPDRHELESGTRLIRQAAAGSFASLDNGSRAIAVKELVRLLLPAYEVIYGSSLPASASPFVEIEAFVSALWEDKYGEVLVDPTVPRQRFIAYGRDEYVARFLLDIGNIVTPSGNAFSPILGFRDPPNDRLLIWSDAAAMSLSLLREAPDQAAVEVLAASLPADQVLDTLEDARYAERFAVGDLELVHLADNWRESSWLGYYYDADEGWNYHLELGWIYFEMENQAENRFWFYDQEIGWSFTSAEHNPYLYSTEMETWMFRHIAPLTETEGERWFFNFKEGNWKTY